MLSAPPPASSDGTAAGCERILVVEDDDLVRANARSQLESLGYSVDAVGGVLRQVDQHRRRQFRKAVATKRRNGDIAESGEAR